MRRLIGIISILLVCTLLAGCIRAEGVNDNDLALAKQFIAITDDVIKGNTDAEKAAESLKFKSTYFENTDLEPLAKSLAKSVERYSKGAISSDDLKKAKRDFALRFNL